MTKARDLANASTALSAVSATELAFVDGVTSAIQTQMDAKAPSSTAVTLTGTQTLTNKTLTSPALTTPTISTATTNGDILDGTGSGALARLGIGSAANVLTVSGGVPAWAAPAGGGKVLQVVQTTYTTEAVSTSTTYADSGLSLSITPTSATSKILALVNFATGSTRAAAYAASKIRFMRGSTEIAVMGGGTHNQAIYFEGDTMTYTLIRDIFSFNYLDSPATTSATTYKVQFAVGQQPGGPTVTSYAQPDSNRSILTLMEIGA